jgi:hypothetical protein
MIRYGDPKVSRPSLSAADIYGHVCM